jgi:hypothetical protein
MEYLPAYGPGTESGGIPLGPLEASRVTQRLPKGSVANSVKVPGARYVCPNGAGEFRMGLRVALRAICCIQAFVRMPRDAGQAGCDSRPARIAAMLRSIKLACDQSSVPAQRMVSGLATQATCLRALRSRRASIVPDLISAIGPASTPAGYGFQRPNTRSAAAILE